MKLSAVALALSVVLSGAASAAAPSPVAALEQHRGLGCEIMRELIKTDTTSAHGSTTAAAEKLDRLLKAH